MSPKTHTIQGQHPVIEISIPAGFEAERRYVIHVLCSQLLGLEYSIQINEGSRVYHWGFHGRGIEISDHFFIGPESGFYSDRHVPDSVTFCTSPGLEDIVCIYGNDELTEAHGVISCGADLIAGAFFMLTRWEEAVLPQRDAHGRFPGTASLACRAGFLDRPVVAEYAALMKKWFLSIGVPVRAFREHRYRFLLQSDVDTALYWDAPFAIFRKIGFRLVRERAPGKALGEIGRYMKYLREGHDPYNTYDLLMDIAEEKDSKATFFFPVGGADSLDNRQTLRDKHVHNFFQHIILRGHEAGVHYSYHTADHPELMQEETRIFRQYFQGDLRARQHYLRCTVPQTWKAWEEAGLSEDFTLGYPEAPGFRCGMCHPFSLFDIHDRRMLSVIERPLIAMDVTFRFYLKSDPGEALDRIRTLKETVKEHGGEFVFLWHNSSFGMEWREWELLIFDS